MFNVKYTYEYEKVLTKEELEVFKEAIKNNKKVPMSEMGEGVNEVAFRVTDVTESLLENARAYTNINSIEKVYKYLSLHERDHHDYWNIVAEESYAFPNKEGKMIAHTEPPYTNGATTEIIKVEGKYDTNINKIDGNLDAYVIDYKRNNTLKR